MHENLASALKQIRSKWTFDYDQLFEELLSQQGNPEDRHLYHQFVAAQVEPPITRQSLRELDIEVIVDNFKLRHDVNFDRELQFQPDLDGNRGRAEHENRNAYWNAITAEIELYRIFIDPVGIQPHQHGLTVQDVLKYGLKRLPKLLEAIRDIINSILPESDQKAAVKVLDADTIGMSIREGIDLLPAAVIEVAKVLQRNCAPTRDSMIDDLLTSIRQDDPKCISRSLQEMISVVEAMRIDSVKHKTKMTETSPLSQWVQVSSIWEWLKIEEVKMHQDRLEEKTLLRSMNHEVFPHDDKGRSTESKQTILKRSYEIHGNIASTAVAAIPDTGSELNIIAESFSMELGTTVDTSSTRKLRLASGKIVKTKGTVKIPWRYAGEQNTQSLLCHVLANCNSKLILGSRFLGMDFMKRVKTCFRPLTRVLGVKLLGSERKRVWGHLNGCEAMALPDMGSDVLLVSRAYAIDRGWYIDRSPHRNIELEFPDGSRRYTNGIIENLQWAFGSESESITRDFYVLDDLPVDIILSNDVLFDSDAFNCYEDYFFDLEDDQSNDVFELHGVKQIGWFSDTLQSLYQQYIRNGESC
jgi:T-complex protein 11